MWIREVHNSGANPIVKYGQPFLRGDVLDPGARTGCTVVRIIGDFVITAGAAVSAVATVRFGVAVVDTVGWTDANLPPISPEPHRNGIRWLHWRSLSIAAMDHYVEAATAHAFHYGFDIKVMQKIRKLGDNVIWTVEAVSFPGNTGVQMASSTLIKLS